MIVPSWREGPRLLEAIDAARKVVGDAELIVSACEEDEPIRRAAQEIGAIWIETPRPCRGLQLAVGALRAGGHHLMFLHADTRLPAGAAVLVLEALSADGVAGGAFRLRFDGAHPALTLLSWLSRAPIPGTFLGDQCLFCTRRSYEVAGGFQALPLFEDVDFVSRLAGTGRLVRLDAAVTTSARRFLRIGPVRQLAKNALLLAGWHLRLSPERLSAWYQPEVHRVEPPPSRRGPCRRRRRIIARSSRAEGGRA